MWFNGANTLMQKMTNAQASRLLSTLGDVAGAGNSVGYIKRDKREMELSLWISKHTKRCLDWLFDKNISYTYTAIKDSEGCVYHYIKIVWSDDFS